MPRTEEVEWESCCVEPRRDPELEQALRRASGGGTPNPGYFYFADCPWIALSLVELQWARDGLAQIDVELAEKIAVVVSHDNSCRYCFAAHRALMRFVGTPEERIRRLEQDLLTAELPPEERAALELARRLSRANPPLSHEDLEGLRRHGASEAAIREMALVAAVMVSANRIATLPAIPPQPLERYPDRWLVRLAAPIAGRWMRSRWRRGAPTFLTPQEKTGPFAAVLNSFDGLPLARKLRRVVDSAWSSPLLPRRAKALAVAVVARGLGCEVSQREAARLAAEEGLSPQTLEQVLAHLAAPELDPLEALLVPFVRETVWYQPAPIQRRARAVREKLSAGEFLELSGVVGLANMFCRLGVFAEPA